MPIPYSEIQWVVQRNLTHVADFDYLKLSCEKAGVFFQAIDIIPFTDALPEFDTRRKSIIYGSTTFCGLAAADGQLKEGLFFDNDGFSIENYFQQWGKYMLNYGAVVTTFKELMSQEAAADQLFFIRPGPG